MKPSRAITKAGLVLATIGGVIVTNLPRIALFLADLGDRLSGFGVKIACYGH